MSVVRSSYTWRAGIIESNLPPTTRHVLLTLSCHFNDAGEACYPSTKRLAEETGLTERSVITHLTTARELGWLHVSKHGFAGQQWKRNQYTPSFPEGAEARSVPSKKGTEARSAPCEKGTEPNDKKALKDVQSNYSVDLLITTTTTTAPTAHAFNELNIEPAIAPFLPQLLEILRHANIADSAHAQDLLDELAGTIEAGNRGDRRKVGNPVSWLQAVAAGQFQRARCVEVQARRQASKATAKRVASEPPLVLDPIAMANGGKVIDRIRSRRRL